MRPLPLLLYRGRSPNVEPPGAGGGLRGGRLEAGFPLTRRAADDHAEENGSSEGSQLYHEDLLRSWSEVDQCNESPPVCYTGVGTP